MAIAWHVDPYVKVSLKSWYTLPILGLPKVGYVHTCGPVCQSICEIPGFYFHPGIVQR